MLATAIDNALAFGVLLAVIGGIVAFRYVEGRALRSQGVSRRSPPSRVAPAHRFEHEHVVRRLGSSRIGWISASTARLVADREWIRISGRVVVWIPREAVRSIERIEGQLGTHGLAFRSDDGAYDGVIFWPVTGNSIEELVALGWPTDSVRS